MTPTQEDREARARTVLRFLNGEGPLNGLWFGDMSPDQRPYWWRGELSVIDPAAIRADERRKVIEECARVAEDAGMPYAGLREGVMMAHVAAAIRGLMGGEG